MRKEVCAKFSIRLPDQLNMALEKICATRRGVTKTEIIKAAVQEYLFPEGADKREAEVGRHLKRLDRRIKSIERGNEILGETLSVFIRAWLTNTSEVPESQKEVAEIQGGRRYQRFMHALSTRLQSGRCLFGDLPEDVFEVASPEEFFTPDKALEKELEGAA